MTKSQLLKSADSREIAEWIAYFKVETAMEKKQDNADTLKAKFQSLVPPRAKKSEANKHRK
jgi:hypothetical protein